MSQKKERSVGAFEASLKRRFSARQKKVVTGVVTHVSPGATLMLCYAMLGYEAVIRTFFVVRLQNEARQHGVNTYCQRCGAAAHKRL
mgnify:CR=1 FL=1